MITNDQLIAQHIKEKEVSRKFKERRLGQWNENYYLFRDKVLTNRLTQRQPVNIPIVRETLQTWISKIDEAPELKFETRGKENKDKDGEILINELWSYYYDALKLELVDNLDKKIVGLQGRSFKKWGFSKNKIFCDIIDPFDIEIDPRTNPLELESASFVIHTHIFRSLKEILANPKYTSEGKKELKIFLDSKQGLIKAASDQNSFDERNRRLETLGAHNFDEYQASDVMVEINESYKLLWDDEEKKFVRYLIIFATDSVVLYKEKLKKAIGISKLPIVSWASDPDLNDLWSDGIADNVRTFNKITNMYISQDLESRTYRNFGMYFFNTLNGTFQPRSFEAKPFGMYGVPGNPSEIVQQMKIEPIGDTAGQITFLKELIQSSVAQTAAERGIKQPGEQTLGQVQLQLQQSNTRNHVVSKNYRRAWKESGEIFYELLKANSSGKITLYKKGADGNYYSKDIDSIDWINPLGYECKVIIKSDADAQDDLQLKKIQYMKNSFATNPSAIKIAKRKELEILGLTTNEIEQIMQFEEQQSMPLNTDQLAPSKEQNPQDNPLNNVSQ